MSTKLNAKFEPWQHSDNLTQLGLISAITRHLDRHGHPTANERQWRAIIQAANMVLDAMRQPHQTAQPGMGIDAWLASNDTGLSSRYLAHLLTGKPEDAQEADPLDPDDLGRCIRMLDAVPGSRDELARLRWDDLPGAWKAYITHWDELEALYLEEAPTGKAPRTLARMDELRRGI